MMAGIDILRDPLRNKGTAFTAREREALGLTGLLPPRVETIDEQVARVRAELATKASALEKYAFLAAVQAQNEMLFYRTVASDTEALLPVVYTPTVGEACLAWSRLYVRPRGLYITARDAGRVRDVLGRWPRPDVTVIVVTDGGRILGLGDLGANGMGIPIGKLALYVACGGIAPAACLPVTLDVGTDTLAVREDPHYIGVREPRLRGPAYDALVDEFVNAAQHEFPGVLVQFEDFANADAFRLLARHRDRVCSFNDDIQGTGAMGLAGILAALRATGQRLADQRFLFFGAGEANLGIGAIVVEALARAGLSEAQARARCWYIDSRGLVSTDRHELAPHKRPFAQPHIPCSGLADAIASIRPTILIGASGQAGAFDAQALGALARCNERPVVFALSNPTAKAECTAEQAYRATGGRAIFASGSPFAPVTFEGRTHVTGQANNCFVFPGVGLAVLATRARRVSDAMWFAAAEALAAQVTEADLAAGRIFPAAARIRCVAEAVAVAVARVAYDEGLATQPRPAEIGAFVRAAMVRPEYT